MARYLGRVLREATAASAAVVLVIDSTGGRVDAALDMRDTLLRATVPTVAFVDTRAWSAAALVAMASDALFMAPGSSIGAAEPAPLTVKTLAAVRAEFEATAEARGRDRQLAAAMVDADVAIPGVIERGKLLGMTANSAFEMGFTEGVARSVGEALDLVGLGGLPRQDVLPTAAERLASFVTHPAVAPILLTIALVALVVEVFSAGFGLAGTIGLASLALFFGGHMIAGFGGWEVAALFILGLVLLMVEAFMPGFGVFGLGGVASIVASIYLASRGSGDALRSLAIAIVASVLLSILILRVGIRRGLFARLTLGQAMTADQGYVAREQRTDLVGQVGVAVTMLRPAGTARFGDASFDVVSEGMYIAAGTEVIVIQVEGPRVVVRSHDRPPQPAPS
jgi:membrane-bound serine protease (ClpP class)